MKQLAIVMFSLLIINSAEAKNTPNLEVKITGADQSNTYFLCVANIGCINMSRLKEKTLPMTPGHVNYIFVANAKNLKMYTQTLPARCNVNINENQTLTISGQLIKEENNKNAYIKNLKCSVS
jgi:hypothetical protein